MPGREQSSFIAGSPASSPMAKRFSLILTAYPYTTLPYYPMLPYTATNTTVLLPDRPVAGWAVKHYGAEKVTILSTVIMPANYRPVSLLSIEIVSLQAPWLGAHSFKTGVEMPSDPVTFEEFKMS